MNNTTQEHIEEMEVEEFHEKVRRIKEVQQWCWTYAGIRGEQNQGLLNRVPAEKLEFVPYEVGDFFFTRVVPKRTPKNKKEEERIILSSKLQFRYAGPYMIKEVLSPILYRAIIHNKDRVVHAINMKPANRKRKFIKRLLNVKKKIATSVNKKSADIVQEKQNNTDSEEEEEKNFEGERVVINFIPLGTHSFKNYRNFRINRLKQRNTRDKKVT
jgi:hypothetical protein